MNIGELEIESKAPETQRLCGEGGEKSAVQAELVNETTGTGAGYRHRMRSGWNLTFYRESTGTLKWEASVQILEPPGCHLEKWPLHHSRQEGPESWFSAGLTRS